MTAIFVRFCFCLSVNAILRCVVLATCSTDICGRTLRFFHVYLWNMSLSWKTHLLAKHSSDAEYDVRCWTLGRSSDQYIGRVDEPYGVQEVLWSSVPIHTQDEMRAQSPATVTCFSLVLSNRFALPNFFREHSGTIFGNLQLSWKVLVSTHRTSVLSTTASLQYARPRKALEFEMIHWHFFPPCSEPRLPRLTSTLPITWVLLLQNSGLASTSVRYWYRCPCKEHFKTYSNRVFD